MVDVDVGVGLTCEYCKKKYVRKSAFNNHLVTCKFSRLCKNSEVSNLGVGVGVGVGVDLTKMNVNINDIYKMLIHLHNKYDKLEADYNELKKFVVITKSKIDIIDYLNQHLDFGMGVGEGGGVNFVNFMDYITDAIGIEDLELLFKYDYVDGIYQIFVNMIERGGGQMLVPIKAFNHKEWILYIYIDENTGWIIMNEDYLNRFIRCFDKKLLKLFLEWKTKAEATMDGDQFAEVYVLNMKKVIGGNFDSKNKNKRNMIKNKLYKYLKVSLKNVVRYEVV